MKARPLFLGIHRYLGLLATIPIVLLSVSGAMVAFEGEIDRAINPAYWNVTPQSQVLPWQAVVDAARQAYPAKPVSSLVLPPAPGVAAAVGLKGGLLVTVDPYTGKVLGSRQSGQAFINRLHQFHTNLLLGEWGSRINGVSALLCVVISVTGLILWWKRRALGIKWSAPWRRVNYDVHHALGIGGMLPWLILGVTGAAVAFEGVVRPALYRLTSSTPPVPPPLHSKNSPGAEPLTVDAALAAAASTLPGAQTVVILLPAAPTGAFMAMMKFPEDRTPAGRSRVAVDQFTGRPLWTENSRSTAAVTSLWNKNRMIHTGDIYGWSTRVLACVASLVLAAQAISGAWMWWGRARKPESAEG